MKLRTIKILALSFCLFSSVLLSGQVGARQEVKAVVKPDSITATEHIMKHIKGTPVPDTSGPEDIHLDRTESIRFLHRIYSSAGIWKRSNDPLREALRHLIYFSSRPPVDSTINYLSGYGFEKIRIPPEHYYVFDSIRIILPVIQPDTTIKDTVNVPSGRGEMFIEAGRKLEKVKLSSDETPVLKNDTIALNDSVYILVKDFIPAVMPQKANDTIILVITDTLPEQAFNTVDFPFRYLNYPSMSDSLEAAVKSLIGYLEDRDSTLLKVTGENGRGTDVWLNSMSDNLVRFWLPDGKGDSVTVWVGSPERNTLSLKAEEGIQFRKETWHDRYVDTRVNVTTAREENLRKVALSRIKPEYWRYRSEISYLLSQGMFSNWAKGGDDNVSSVLDITNSWNYNNKVTNVSSASTLRTALGLQASGRDYDIRKNLDILELNSKIGHKAFGKFDLSGIFQFKTQFLPGYTYTNDTIRTKVSKFFNPATLILGYGLDYKPDKNTSISFSPVSYKGTFVSDTADINQTKFGIPEDRRSKNEMGAYFTVSSKVLLFDKVSMSNKLQLFSNFLSKPQNVDVDWEMVATMNLNWFTDLRLNTHLIYDDNTKLPVFDKEDKPVLNTDGKQKKSPMLQFKEYFGLSFVFKF